jgi:predicted RNA-binding protein with TRAM domain
VDCPVELGSEYDVEISQMSPNGEGMASFKGFWVFVRNVKLGEKVKVRITFLDSISADAEVISRT